MSVLANISPLEWDSEFFAFPIAKLTDVNRPDSPRLTADAFDHYHLVQAKVAAGDYGTLNDLRRLGFQIVDGEIDLRLTSARQNGQCLNRLEPARQNDIPKLKALAGEGFSLSRFRQPWFSPQDNSRLYRTWVEKSVQSSFDDCCLVMRDSHSAIKGFVTLKRISAQHCRVGLLAVNQDYRRQGVGEALVNGALLWSAAAGAEHLNIATQTGNIPALRLYIKCGAMIASSSYWLYRSTNTD